MNISLTILALLTTFLDYKIAPSIPEPATSITNMSFIRHIGTGQPPFIVYTLKWDYTNSLMDIVFNVYKKTNLTDSYRVFGKTYALSFKFTNVGPSGFFGVQASNELTKLGSVY